MGGTHPTAPQLRHPQLGCAVGLTAGRDRGSSCCRRNAPVPTAPLLRARSSARYSGSRRGDGHTWGSWGPWSICSSSCGDGVALRMVSAEELCRGEPRQYRVCHPAVPQGCPRGAMPFRAMQCSLYDTKPVLAPNVCDLNCLAAGHNFYYTFGRVLDGTRCSPDSPDLCVGGRCLVGVAGCDGILGSGVQPDACGQCGGSPGTCIFVHRVPSLGCTDSSGQYAIPRTCCPLAAVPHSQDISLGQYSLSCAWTLP
uniref:Uncharacterized protein n=1 Tax=Nothoprocta perdicaria TaxID=30464 RepID=A0A8C6YKC6_NOTPE